ncbi:TetR/AcrR family transcriptional regulator [Actinoplanes sp. NPDC049118]|uniref:TetR/AcrR family transcriptional regulator n=1 Tax=Actinoplanes sp. NPDC049118 TaxID=3155769 RepID=UPI0033D6D264
MPVTAKRRADTRAALLAAAERSFRTKGYSATTMADIAEAAGVSRPTAFRYFRTKADLVFSVQDEWQQTVRDVAAERPGTGWTLVRRCCDAVAEQIERDADRVLAAYRLSAEQPSLTAAAAARDRGWIQVMAELLAGDAADEPDALLMGAAIMGMINMAIILWADAPGTTDLRRTIHRGLDLLPAGPGSAKGGATAWG